MADTTGKAVAAPATTDKPKQKRKVLTAAERIAKAEQDLADLRDKAQAGDRKRLGVVNDKIAKLQSKRDELSTQLGALGAEKNAIEARLAPAKDKA